MTMPTVYADDDDEPRTMTDVLRAEANRVRRNSDLQRAAVNSPGRQRISWLLTCLSAMWSTH